MPAGDYVVDPPIGFWPDYLRAIVREISSFYGVDIKIQWNLFSNSGSIMDSVRSGQSDMTDLYMILSAFHNGVDRIEAFSVTCSPGGYESTFSVLRSSGITSVSELNNVLEGGEDVRVGALSSADFSSVQPFISTKAVPSYYESNDEMRQRLLNHELIAAVTSTNPGDTEDFVTFRSGVVSPRAPMMLADVDAVEGGDDTNDSIPLIIWILVVVIV